MFFKIFGFCLCLASLNVHAKVYLTGAGASFPSPIYSKWSEIYYQQHDIQINYQVIGSGGGIKQISLGTIDFAATDKPLTPKQLSELNLIQFPMVYGAVVPVINLPQIKSGYLKLNADLLKKIFLGKVTKWSDPAIRSLNNQLPLPDLPITVVHRADGAGTTFIFTQYLAKSSKEWSNRVGSGLAIKWPIGLGGKGNDGVAMYVKSIPGAIGYVEYVYMLNSSGLRPVQLLNHANHYVLPSLHTMTRAVEHMQWEQMSLGVIDAPGLDTWPLTGTSYLLLSKKLKSEEPLKYQALLDFIQWCLEHGEQAANDLGYVMNSSLIHQKILKVLYNSSGLMMDD